MLDSVTKKRIDDLRNILVGKIPSPQSQVEQITTGLIYKFMHDMDNEAIEMGGVPSFFVDEYEKYSCLFDSGNAIWLFERKQEPNPSSYSYS